MDPLQLVRLGPTDLEVTRVGLGCAPLGGLYSDISDEQAAEVVRTGLGAGINFLDTAELYPVPGSAETKGMTDETVAKFLKGRKREDVVLATKVSGRSDRMDWLRKDGSFTEVNREQILESVDASLERLGTDYIDLLQIHWPDRYTVSPFLRSLAPTYEYVCFQ